jgi:choline monooxygenase
VDREALEHSFVRRLIDHLDHHTTDMADHILELPPEVYTFRG